jgi:predicted restriction endonuclease
MNRAYLAHIVADEPRGPRGDPKRSRRLAKELANIMLLCDAHHRLVDKERVAEHPESVLLAMKAEHEERIETLTAIQVNRRTQILVFQANIVRVSPVRDRAFRSIVITRFTPS